MIKCYLLNAQFKERQFSNFKVIEKNVNLNRNKIYHFSINQIITLLHQLGKEIINDNTINKLDGVNYLAFWLRKDNLYRLCQLNYSKSEYIDNFQVIDSGTQLMAQPRGIVCHWIAGNIPTLALFSLIQSILSKNGNIVKIPQNNKLVILMVLNHLANIKINVNGITCLGKDIVKSIAIISFSSGDSDANKQFSAIADCKIIWGGTLAIKSIISLPQKDHCEVIIFGPKYSFGIFAKDYIESNNFERAIKNSILDIVLFNQLACSSPHTFFFEKSKYTLVQIANKFRLGFEKLPQKYLEQALPEQVISRVINTRGVYLLDRNKEIIKSKGLEWTILINNNINLEEPIQGKCIFLKEVNKLKEIFPLITRKIQAVSVGILNQQDREIMAKELSYGGADRIVSPGKMHNFDSPWDGIFTMNRLVRWVVLKD